MPLKRAVDQDGDDATSPSFGVIIAMSVAFICMLLGLGIAFSYQCSRIHRSKIVRRTSRDRRSEEEEVKEDMDDEYQVGTPRSPARITAVLNTPDLALFTPPTVTLAARTRTTPEDIAKIHRQSMILCTPSPLPPSSPLARNRRSMPQFHGRPVPLPLESIEEGDEEAVNTDARDQSQETTLATDSRPAQTATAHTPPHRTSIAAESAQTFEEAVQRFMNHMNDQRAFVQEHSSDARAINRRLSETVEPVVSVCAIPEQMEAGEKRFEDAEAQEDFVSSAWSYYGTSIYGQRFSTATNLSVPLDDDDETRPTDRHPDIPHILVSTH